MNKPYTMVFYEIQNQQRDYYHNDLQVSSSSDEEEQIEKIHQHPNAFILSIPVKNVTLRTLRERFPWRIIERIEKIERSKCKMQFKIKEISDKVDDINVWITLSNEDQKVPLYSGDNIIYTKIKID